MLLQRSAGNRAVAAALEQRRRRPAPRPDVVTIQRKTGAGVQVPVKFAVNLPGFTSKLQQKTSGWPINLEKLSAEFEGSWSAGTDGDQEVKAGPQFGKPGDIGTKVDVKVVERKLLERMNGDPQQPTLSLSGAWELTGDKTEIGAAVQLNGFGMNTEAKLTLLGLAWDEKTLLANGGQPKAQALNLSLSGGFNLPELEVGGGKLTGSVKLVAEFEPNWVEVLKHVVRSVGVSYAVPAAAVAGGAAIIYFGYKDANRQLHLGVKLRAMADAQVRAGFEYSRVVTKAMVDAPAQGGTSEARARAHAVATLQRLLADQQLSPGQWRTLLKETGVEDELSMRIAADYTEAAFDRIRDKVTQELKHWHANNRLQAFFAGRSFGDDEAMLEAAINRARANQGMPTLG